MMVWGISWKEMYTTWTMRQIKLYAERAAERIDKQQSAEKKATKRVHPSQFGV